MSGEARSARRPRLAHALGWPLRRALDPRARWVAGMVDEHVGRRLDHQTETLAGQVEQTRLAAERAEQRVRALEARVDAHERTTLRVLGAMHVQDLGGGPGELSALDADVAAFLNWCAGPEGYAAQAGMWFNEPVPVEHHAGSVQPLLVNERLIEAPFAFGVLAGLPAGARVLDVGGAESTVALALSSLGLEVTVVDPRGYPLEHPGLSSVVGRLEDLDAKEPFDAAVALSTIEHIGLGFYFPEGDRRPGHRADLEAMRVLRERVRPGGLLVLTVPIGDPSVDEFQRVYDADGVRELLSGWEVRELTAAWQRDRLTWVAGVLDKRGGERGVALSVAVNSHSKTPAETR